MEVLYVYNDETKELSSGGRASLCPAGGIGKILFDNMTMHGESNYQAQIDGDIGKEESYQEFLEKCVKIALFMKDQGLQAGDIIAMCSQNNMNNSAVLIASLFIGVITASTDPAISVEDTKHLLALVEPKFTFVCEKSLNLIQNAMGEQNAKIITLFEHDSFENVPTILKKYNLQQCKSFEPIFIEDTKTSNSIILFSSGTTGLPKGICLSHDRMYEDISFIESPPGTRICGFTTLYWLSGVLFTLATFYRGLVKVNFREFSAKSIWHHFDKYKVNTIHMSYSHCMDSIKYLTHPMPHLKALLIVGGQIPTIFYNEYKDKLPETLIFCGYGMTEIGCVAGHVGNCPVDSAGLIVVRDIILRVVDPEADTPIDLNQIGEIRVKGKNQMNGYFKQDSSDCWDERGFFKTGDLGYLDDSYQLFIVDRIKETFKYHSWHVAPAKIEKALQQHPSVLHAVVIGVTVDNDVHAMGLVVLKDGHSDTSDELLKFTNDKMDDIHQIRAGIKCIANEDLPFTASGKINRRKLKQMYSQS